MLYLATVRAGGVFLPLNTAYTASEVEYFVNDAKPRIVVCAPEDRESYAGMVQKLGARLETLGVWKDDKTFAGTVAGYCDFHGRSPVPYSDQGTMVLKRSI